MSFASGTRKTARTQRPGEAGFTLVEALVSIVILAFGLVAVTNLLIVAGSSSQVANAQTATASIAAEQMEMLKVVPFVSIGGGPSLVPGGDLANDAGGYFRNTTNDPRLRIPGVGAIWVRWLVAPVPGNAQMRHITVRAEAEGGLYGRRTRAEFTSFRSCTAPVPQGGVCQPVGNTCCPPAP